MANYDIDEAANQFSELIDLALAGESIVVTRNDMPVVKLTPIAPIVKEAKPITPISNGLPPTVS